MISAKAGGINAITGLASVTSRGEGDWQQLMITYDLEAGDRVRTANDGRVEILLNPGSYLRVGGNSEVELSNNALDNLEVRLIRGTAIVEATGIDGMDLNISISTPHTKLAIVRQGLYRLNVIPGDATELIVRKGRVILSDSHTKVKDGNKVIFSATAVSVAKLTKEEKKRLKEENLDVWSKQRAETLAKANSRITNRGVISASLPTETVIHFRVVSTGLWFYDSGSRCYTFLPFFYGLSSPYGNSYSTSFYSPVWYPGRGYGDNQPRAGCCGNNSPTGGTPQASPSGATPTGPTGGTRPVYSPPTQSSPRMSDPDTGNRMPRKNIELPSRPNN